MNERKLLDGLSYINHKYIQEAETENMPTGRRFKKPIFLAAIIVVMVGLMGSAIVAMRLQHMTVDSPPIINLAGEERTIISLQGFQGSSSYQAFQEWMTFLDSYDPDKAILYANNDFHRQVPEAYWSYGCYSWDMVNKAKEICEKYGLEPLGKAWIFRQPENLFEAVGIRSVFSDTAVAEGSLSLGTCSGYCYPGGSFEIEGILELAGRWNMPIMFSLRSIQKAPFDNAYSSIGVVETYDQWNYTMEDGTPVLLVLRQNEGRIIVDKGDCFVVVGMGSLYGGPGAPDPVPIPNDRAFLEHVCEGFDFTYQVHRVDPNKAYALQCQEEPHTYAALIEYMLAERSVEYPNLCYALVDINADGQEELLLQSKDAPYLKQTQHTIEDTMFCMAIGSRDGELVDVTGGGHMYLCEGNVVEFLSPFEGEENRRSYYRYDRFYRYEPVDEIIPRDGKLCRQVGGDLVEITQEEADAIAARYPRVEIEFKPARQFLSQEEQGAQTPQAVP